MSVSQLIHRNSVTKYKIKWSFVIFNGNYWFLKEKGWLKEIIHHFFVIFAPKFNKMPDICRISISDDSFVHFFVKIIGAPKKFKNNFEKKAKSFENFEFKNRKKIKNQHRWENLLLRKFVAEIICHWDNLLLEEMETTPLKL